MLKDILENGNIPFTDLLPNQELIMPIALSLGYTPTILNSEYRWIEIVKDDEGNDVESQLIGRIEDNSETPRAYINRVLMDNAWAVVKPIIKDIMLAEQKNIMKQKEAEIEASLNMSAGEIRG